MLQRIYEAIKRLFTYTEELRRNRADIESLQAQVRELTFALQRLVFELQRVQEKEAFEREKLRLQWQVDNLRSAKESAREKPTEESGRQQKE